MCSGQVFAVHRALTGAWTVDEHPYELCKIDGLWRSSEFGHGALGSVGFVA